MTKENTWTQNHAIIAIVVFAHLVYEMLFIQLAMILFLWIYGGTAQKMYQERMYRQGIGTLGVSNYYIIMFLMLW